MNCQLASFFFLSSNSVFSTYVLCSIFCSSLTDLLVSCIFIICVIAIFNFVKQWQARHSKLVGYNLAYWLLFKNIWQLYYSILISVSRYSKQLGGSKLCQNHPCNFLCYCLQTEPDLSLILYSFARFFSYYASIVLVVLYSYYSNNFADKINTSLHAHFWSLQL